MKEASSSQAYFGGFETELEYPNGSNLVPEERKEIIACLPDGEKALS